jgi:hypothetical protein
MASASGPGDDEGWPIGQVILPARLIPQAEAVPVMDWRISPPAAQWRFAWWQARAGFDRRDNIHALRRSTVTNVCRVTRDLLLAQRFALHPSPLTTVICIHPADEEPAEGVMDLPCRGSCYHVTSFSADH